MLYPFTFQPILKERLWGGRNLAALYRKPLPPGARIGESWEICDRPGEASVIANGPLAGKDLRWLMDHHPADVLGEAATVDGRFPLLVKILDAREILSVQVHPPAACAARLNGEPKTELWYVTQAGVGAELSAGLKAGITRSEFERRLRDGTVSECIHQVPVQVGDAMFLPSGRIHALGAGLVIFEIQQNSDTTYRVFDWNRLGPDGQARELHVEAALACIDFADFEPGLVTAGWAAGAGRACRRLVDDPRFTVTESRAPTGWRQMQRAGDRPTILAVVTGALGVNHPESGGQCELTAGEFALLPAGAREVELAAGTEVVFLEALPGTAR